jgi:AcrR family transcriptional regulator
MQHMVPRNDGAARPSRDMQVNRSEENYCELRKMGLPSASMAGTQHSIWPGPSPVAPCLITRQFAMNARAGKKVSGSNTVSPMIDEQWQAYTAALAAKWASAEGDRKQERSKRREQEILRAALRVFARDGISRARIGDIASEAGMPVSSLYDYYPSKEDLAYAVPQEHLTRFFTEYASASADKQTFRERLRFYLWLAADFARRNPEWARTLYLEIWPSVLVSESPVKESLDDYVRVIIDLIRGGEAKQEWSAGSSPYETAAILNGSVNQVIIVWLLYRKPRDLMKSIASIIDRTTSLLLAPIDDAIHKSRVRK